MCDLWVSVVVNFQSFPATSPSVLVGLGKVCLSYSWRERFFSKTWGKEFRGQTLGSHGLESPVADNSVTAQGYLTSQNLTPYLQGCFSGLLWCLKKLVVSCDNYKICNIIIRIYRSIRLAIHSWGLANSNSESSIDFGISKITCNKKLAHLLVIWRLGPALWCRGAVRSLWKGTWRSLSAGRVSSPAQQLCLCLLSVSASFVLPT